MIEVENRLAREDRPRTETRRGPNRTEGRSSRARADFPPSPQEGARMGADRAAIRGLLAHHDRAAVAALPLVLADADPDLTGLD